MKFILLSLLIISVVTCSLDLHINHMRILNSKMATLNRKMSVINNNKNRRLAISRDVKRLFSFHIPSLSDGANFIRNKINDLEGVMNKSNAKPKAAVLPKVKVVVKPNVKVGGNSSIRVKGKPAKVVLKPHVKVGGNSSIRVIGKLGPAKNSAVSSTKVADMMKYDILKVPMGNYWQRNTDYEKALKNLSNQRNVYLKSGNELSTQVAGLMD